MEQKPVTVTHCRDCRKWDRERTTPGEPDHRLCRAWTEVVKHVAVYTPPVCYCYMGERSHVHDDG